jgi:hypothetical protein
VLGWLPGSGNAMSGQDSVLRTREMLEALRSGDPERAAWSGLFSGLGAVGAIPGMPLVGGITRKAGELLQILRERSALKRAYDEVRKRPIGEEMDPLVRLQPDQLSDMFVVRGPMVMKGDQLGFEGRGHGLGKIILKHGEGSSKPLSEQITREDILELPRIIRDYLPVQVRGGPDLPVFKQSWHVPLPHPEFGDRPISLAASRFTARDGNDYLVTMHVNRKPGLSFSKERTIKPEINE